METYDDRPISVYDNLNMPNALHTSTPKTRAPAMSAMSTTPPTATSAATTATNGAAHTPYADISFKFNNNNKTAQTLLQQQHQPRPHQQQLQQQQQQQHLLPNSNRSFNQSTEPQLQQQQSQVQTNPKNAAVYYAMPSKPAKTTTTTAASSAAAPLAITTTTAAHASPLQRPLSQHSQSELNEASQNIAAVKAALNDAKSKFFGLNGYAQDSPDTSVRVPGEFQTPTYKVLPTNGESQQPKVLIVTTAPSPKYQNIPENSAIYRQQRPELPPKPNFLAAAAAAEPNASSPAAANASPATPTPLSGRTTVLQSPAAHSTASTPLPKMPPISTGSPQTSTLHSQDKILPHGASYKEIPLNDIDAVQPSQAVYMSTTVPQNIKGSKIAGRHTPTRNSLRHSRMLVVNNKNYRGMQHPNPMNFKYPNLARWLLILQILIGVLISCLAIWIFVLSPSTAVQDNPYWSGLALLLAGILGLVLVRYQRIKRHKVRENCFLFLRADSYLLSLLALLLCAVALICASIHHVRLTASDTRCESRNILLEHGSCSCTFNAAPNDTVYAAPAEALLKTAIDERNKPDMMDNSYKVEYRDMSCQEVNCEWIYILVLSITLNTFGFIVSLLYIVLLACCRHNSKRFYASVHTSTF